MPDLFLVLDKLKNDYEEITRYYQLLNVAALLGENYYDVAVRNRIYFKEEFGSLHRKLNENFDEMLFVEKLRKEGLI